MQDKTSSLGNGSPSMLLPILRGNLDRLFAMGVDLKSYLIEQDWYSFGFLEVAEYS